MQSVLLTASMLCMASAANMRGIFGESRFEPRITASNPCDGSEKKCPNTGVLC
jgi:hypothetical protein